MCISLCCLEILQFWHAQSFLFGVVKCAQIYKGTAPFGLLVASQNRNYKSLRALYTKYRHCVAYLAPALIAG